jgi:RNA polymerase sigma factor (sigma-70 family)
MPDARRVIEMCDDLPCRCVHVPPGQGTTAGRRGTPAQQAGLAELFRQHWYLMVSQVMVWTGAKLEDAEDAVMDAFRAALEDPGRWSQVGNPRGWLCVVAVRCYRRPPGRLRRPAGITEEPIPEIAEEQMRSVQSRAADDPIEMSMQLLHVREVLQTLSGDDQVLMVASFNGLSWAETARLLGRDDQDVRNRVKVIRRELEERFADLHSTRRKGRSK